MFDELFKGSLLFDSDPTAQLNRYMPPDLVSQIPQDQRASYANYLKQQVALSLMTGKDPSSAMNSAQQRFMEMQKYNQGLAMQKQTLSDLARIFGNDPSTPPAAAPTAPADPSKVPTASVDVSPIGATGSIPNSPAPAPAPAPNPIQNAKVNNATAYFKAAQYHAMRGDGDSAKKYLDMGLQLHPNPSEAIRDLEYLGFNMAGTGDAGFGNLKQYNESKSSKVNTTVNTGINKGEEAYWSTLGKNLPELESQAMAANRTNQSLQSMIDLGNKNTFSGSLAPGQVGATQFFNSLGINIKPETLANTREFQAQSNILVLDFMGAMGGARGFSKEESAILYDAFPKIIDSPQARERIARMLITRNNRLINDYNTTRDQFEQGIGKPLASPRIAPFERATPADQNPSAPRIPTYDPRTGKWN